LFEHIFPFSHIVSDDVIGSLLETRAAIVFLVLEEKLPMNILKSLKRFYGNAAIGHRTIKNCTNKNCAVKKHALLKFV